MRILAVFTAHNGCWYTCQFRDEAGGFTCGLCGLGALGLAPKVDDVCSACGAPVAAVQAGATDAIPLPIEGSFPHVEPKP